MGDGWRPRRGYSRRKSNFQRPPQHPGSLLDCGSWDLSVPSWEKRFCSSICLVPWDDICRAKPLITMYEKIAEWDDSGALEAFQNAKARYWAEINGLPCDIPLPGPDIYIDEVDHDAVLDPELVAELEKEPPPPPVENDDETGGWDSFIFRDKPVPATGWGEAEDIEHHSVNWDVYLDKPIQPTGWGDAEAPVLTNWDSNNVWNCNNGWGNVNNGWENSNSGWGNGNNGWENGNNGWGNGNNGWENGNYNSWGGGENNYWDNGKYNSWGPHMDNRNNEQAWRRGRKRNGGHHGARFPNSRHQANNYQTNSSSWKVCKDRNTGEYPYENTMHAGQPMGSRQWKSGGHPCGPMNYQRPADSGGAWRGKKHAV